MTKESSNIPHSKGLEVDIYQDQKLISIIKDGRQKPIVLKVPNAIYTGILLEKLAAEPQIG